MNDTPPPRSDPTPTTAPLDRPRRCCDCGGSYTIRDLLAALRAWWPALDVVRGRRPCCATEDVLQLRTGWVSCGYVEVGGSAHFCPEEEIAAPGLQVVAAHAAPDGLRFRLDGVERVVASS